MTSKPDLDQFERDASLAIKKAIGLAYQRGFEDGSAATRAAIFEAVRFPEVASGVSNVRMAGPNQSLTAIRDRAPRGDVRRTIVEALKNHPEGMNERALASEMERLNPAVSGRSAGGELRRKLGRLYVQRDGKWFLVKEHVTQSHVSLATKTTEGSSSAVPQPLMETSDDPETTIAA